MRLAITIIISLGLNYSSSFQAQDDLGNVLPYDQFIDLVYNYHPLSKQADLLSSAGEISILGARGSFDPKLSSSISQKQFKEDPYYRLFAVDLKVPTKYGLDFYTGYDRTSGVNLNPENSNPDAGLLYAGISLPLGRGLLMDSRRTQLQLAQNYNESTRIEQQVLVNNLILDASLAYWSWWEAFQVFQIYQDAVRIADERFNAVREYVRLGDVPPIDTVEAAILLNDLQILEQQSLIDYLNAQLYLSSFTWDVDGQPILLNDDLKPEETISPSIPTEITENLFLDTLIANHPEFLLYEFKLNAENINLRLAKENLKPRIDVKYNFIVDGGKNPLTNISANNYTWGLDFEIPIFLRKERANIQKSNLKIEQALLDQTNKGGQLYYKLNKAINDWKLSYEQYQLYSSVVDNYRILLTGEQTLFDNGESSLFVINSRQRSYINAQIKLNQLLTKNKIAEVKTDYARGDLYRN